MEYRGKRGLDLVVVAIVAVPAVLAGVVCAAAVALTSRGPVFFRQARVGRGGLLFRLWKFRTMVHDPGGNPLFPAPDRITMVGRVLRRFSLDELPQLLNVVRGEMSVVGPRPTLAYQVERYDGAQRERLAVRPGLTGLAQVQGRNTLTWAERIELDRRYVREQSAWLDVQVLLRTPLALLRGFGVGGHPVDDPIAATNSQ